MGLVRGISDLYVDIMLTLVVISFSGALLTLYTDMKNSFEVSIDDVKEVPTVLLITYRGRNYLIIANHDLSSRKFLIMNGSIKLYELSIGPEEVITVDLGVGSVNELSVVFDDYILRPNNVVLR
ncbi:MAG: hypothetical protein QXH99_07225 [Sulfolobales archaeon]|nr:hypothetical protein [Desulfurococcaceae archaeon]